MNKLKLSWRILRRTGENFSEDNCMKLAASLSYYTIFAIAPLLIIIISIVGSFFGRDAVQGRVYTEIQDLVGSGAALQIQEIIVNVQNSYNTTLSTVIGIIVLFIAATGVFTEIQGSINFIWSVKAKPKKGWLKYLINRALSFVLVLTMGFLLVLAVISSTLFQVLGDKLEKNFPNATVYFLNSLNIVFLLVVITGLFMVVYKVLPDAIISWRDALVGSLFTAILFLAGKYLIGLYLLTTKLGITYGTAASILIILTWVYYSSVILYFGAEFTRAFALETGHGIRPKSTAVFIIKRESKEIPSSRIEI
jgi:membrane protein